jgi:ABC-type glycerol-3-phosphate transport system substrate-binding protein
MKEKIRIIQMLRTIYRILIALAALSGISCGKNNIAILWSDRPEFAFYAEYFNAAQNQYKAETRYYDYPALELADVFSGRKTNASGKTGTKRDAPDIVAGSWLKSASTRMYFRQLNGYFNDKTLDKEAFYSRLLSMGNIDGKQYLLPVSFNAPMVIIALDRAERLSNPFTIDFNEMKKLGKSYNAETRGVYTRMGFSPIWDDNFLLAAATLLNASFREAEPLAWDTLALERAMDFIYEWINEANSSIQAVDDFTFKYYYNPPEKLALSGRILLAYMDSDGFFTLADDQRNRLDFRWLAERETIPLNERSVYLGLVKNGRSTEAAEAFLRWFFNPETQKGMLEKSARMRMRETSFGVAGGFSAMRQVTEQVFPQFYPDLLRHMPPQDFLSPPNILPSNWIDLKERVILPYLHDRARQPDKNDIIPLERRLADWQMLNR